MATSKKFSELPVASSMNNGDLFAVAQEDAQAETGYTSKSATALVVGKKLNGEIEYATDLPSFPSGYQNPLDALELLKQEILDLYPVNSASGSIANFNTSLALPLVDGKFSIDAQQESGTPTPSDPKAITGYSGMNINHSDADTTNPTIYPITFGSAGTVYGGYVDLARQKLVVTHKSLLLDGGDDRNWIYREQTGSFYTVVSDMKSANNGYILCDKLEKYSGSSSVLCIRAGANNSAIYIYNGISLIGGQTSATAWKNYLASNNMTIVYELATPIEYDLTVPEIVTLIGTNNIWCDTNGESEVEFKQGIQEYIDAKIAETQALIL